MTITEQKSNEIKLKIIRQLKDPTSALSALLGRKDYLEIEGPWPTNNKRPDIALSIPELNLMINLVWDESIPQKNKKGPFFLGDGGYNIYFLEGVNPDAMNISDKGALIKITRHEQFISESPLTPNLIAFGYRSFRVSHEDYEFFRIVDENSVDTIQYDLAAESFSSDPRRFVSQWEWKLKVPHENNDTFF